MANIILPPDWNLKSGRATDRKIYNQRRAFVKRLGLGTVGLALGPGMLNACTSRPEEMSGMAGPLDTIPENAPRFGLPAARNAAYTVPERGMTDRIAAATYNNFYEFDGSSKVVWHLTENYDPFPWTIEVEGLVENKLKLDVDELIRLFGLEERVYRFRCVEAWSMTIPWTGFPLKKLIDHCKPLSSATHVSFECAKREDQMPGIKAQPWYDWPYFEGLRMDEATNELAFVATGVYGEPLPKQHGSPLRLALPWKYGYKGPKAIRKIKFVDKQPKTFWNELQPAEYSFLSNVNPRVPHPRWSQATERFIETESVVRRVPTQPYNGYGSSVGHLYPDEKQG